MLRTIFHRWHDRYLQRGAAGLEDQSPKPRHVWNRISDEVRRKVVKLALKATKLLPRELAVTFTDTESYFVSEVLVYRVLKADDLITSPAFIVIKAASEFKDKTTAVNPLLLSGMQSCPAG
ncbi:helix-turn-helix domain-containing protein [Parasedimentitalea marina]|uniref:Helix-turn-helix domain-containing protein n=1 Tax=Parasedimentitalea marina TaxID=2483033 RepID=A0A3T0N8G6_9RHOB|nr:helix-turn-helix domain-containing protein [Parasedimentitalea marina]